MHEYGGPKGLEWLRTFVKGFAEMQDKTLATKKSEQEYRERMGKNGKKG